MDPAELAPCGVCEGCVQVAASTHPDLIEVRKPDDRATLPIELLIGGRETRMREGLCHDISLRPYGRRKIAILDDADTLNKEGANCLLKTLEEPPPDSVLILIGTNLQGQLPTIRSRCQAILFQQLSDENLTELILREEVVEDEEQARELARASAGSLSQATLLADPELLEFRTELLKLLGLGRLPIVDLAKRLGGIVDAAGKEAKLRRERLKLLMHNAADFYRAVLLEKTAVNNEQEKPVPLDPLVANAVNQAAGHWKGNSRDALGCWKKCLEAIELVDRNANQAALLEEWAADIATLSRC